MERREGNIAAAATSGLPLLGTTLDYESQQSIRRFSIAPVPLPAAGTSLRLVVQGDALLDPFGNVPTTGVDQTFT